MAVSDLVEAAKDYAEKSRDSAESILGRIGEKVDMAIGAIDPVTYTAATLPPRVIVTPVKVPLIAHADFDTPVKPGLAPVFQDISEIDTSGAPIDATTAPVLTFPEAPGKVRDFTDKADRIKTDFDFPPPPDALMHPQFVAPDQSSISMPVAPEIGKALADIAITGSAPTDIPKAPDDLVAPFSDAYKAQSTETKIVIDGYLDAQLLKLDPGYRAQMAAIDAKLRQFLDPNYHGSGIKPVVEDAIYGRARSKNDAESRRVRDAAYGEAASRGFTLPTGALMSAVQRARQGAADNNATAAREIVVMRAEMEQKNLQWAVTTSAGMRTALLNTTMTYMQHLVSVNGQALDYAKGVLGAIIERYNGEIKLYGLRLEVYRTEVSVYETRLRGVLARIEVFKGQLSAAQTVAEIDKVQVERYKAQLDSLNSLATAYRSQIESVVAQAGLERIKLDIFGLQVKAFEADVQAKNAEWNGFSQLIAGEKGKAEIYQSQIASFSAQSAAYKTKIDAQIAVRNSAAATNDARAKQFTAEYSGFESEVRGQSAVTNANIESNRQVMNEFKGEVAVELAKAQSELEFFKTDATIRLEQASKDLEAKAKNMEKGLLKAKVGADAAVSAGKIYGDMASAAMSGMVSIAGEMKYD